MDSNRELNMSVSPICRSDSGKKYAYVKFEDGTCFAEGKIPACHIEHSEGFAPDEIDALEVYMRENLQTLKNMAADIHVLDAFLER